MIKRFCKPRVVVVYLLICAIAVALGCSLKDESPEVLNLCGNHSCGDLVMVTIDTSAQGWQYLEPAISPNGTQIALTADGPLERRKIVVLPLPEDPWSDAVRFRTPALGIAELGGRTILLNPFISWLRATQIMVVDAQVIDKGRPVWVNENTLLMVARFGQRDRMLIVDISNPNLAVGKVVYYEPDDLVPFGGWVYYHSCPALSPNGRWLLFSRFGCDREPNAYEPGWPEDAECTKQSLWVLDMQTIVTENIQSPDDLRAVVAFQLTSEALQLIDPAWSPDGQTICFAATTDLIGQHGSMTAELFSIRFDTLAAIEGEDAVVRGLDLRRLTTTSILEGDPIIGLHNYAPTFNVTGNEIYFTSTRRAPATTRRARSIWRIPSDGRLEPQILFYSYRDDMHPTSVPGQPWVLFSSRMGFPTFMMDWVEQGIVDSLTRTHPWFTEIEIRRQAREKRQELEFYEDVMSHLYLFRGF